MREYILAHDIGTEINKASIVDADGKIIASCTEEYGVSYPQAGWGEQDPEMWWNAILKTTRMVMKGIEIREMAKEHEELRVALEVWR